MKKFFAVILCLLISVSVLPMFGGCGFIESSPPDLTYQLTESDYDEFTESVTKFTELTSSDSGVFKILAATSKMSNFVSYFETQYYIALVQYYSDPTNEEKVSNYKTAYAYYSDSITAVRSALREIAEGDSELKDAIFDGLTEEEIKVFLVDNAKIDEYNDANAEIELQFDALDYQAQDWDNKVSALYDDYVLNNNAIAKEYGYTDFYALATKEYGRDYDAEDRSVFRGLVAKYIVPLYYEIKAELNECKEKLSDKQNLLLTVFNELRYDTLRDDYIGDYVKTLKGSLRSNMQDFFTDGTAFFVDSETALQGAFTGYLPDYYMPFAYFGPDYQNVLTVVHEMGHYSAFYNYGDSLSILDSMEMHSQGNEWLFISYLDGKMDDEIYDVIYLQRLLDGMRAIILSTVIDQFEETVYTAVDPYESSEFDALMKSICLGYGNIYDEFNVNNYYKRVVIGQPAYYLSYATSEICSINLYLIAEESYAQAVEVYRALQEDLDASLGFCENLTLLGIDSPFDEQTFIEFTTAFNFS